MAKIEPFFLEEQRSLALLAQLSAGSSHFPSLLILLPRVHTPIIRRNPMHGFVFMLLKYEKKILILEFSGRNIYDFFQCFLCACILNVIKKDDLLLCKSLRHPKFLFNTDFVLDVYLRAS